MLGKRKHLRVKGISSLQWIVADKQARGDAKVTNMSISGLDVIIDSHFEPPVGCVFLLEPHADEAPLLASREAKVVWVKELLEDGVKSFRCGLEYIN